MGEAGLDPGAVSTYWDKVRDTRESLDTAIDYLQGADPRDMARLAADTAVSLADRKELPDTRPALPEWFHELEEFHHASSTDQWFVSRSFQDISVEEQCDVLAVFYETELASLDEDSMESLQKTRLKDYCTHVEQMIKRHDPESPEEREGLYALVDRLRKANTASSNESIGYVYERVIESLSDDNVLQGGKEELLFDAIRSFTTAEQYDEMNSAATRISSLLCDDAVQRGLDPFANPDYAVRPIRALQDALRFPSVKSFQSLGEGEGFLHSLDRHVAMAVEHQSPELTLTLLRLGLEVDPRVQHLQEDLGLASPRVLRLDTDRPAGSRASDFVFNQSGQIVSMRETPEVYEESANRLYRCSQKSRIDTPEESEERDAYNRDYAEALLNKGTRKLDEVDWSLLNYDSTDFIERHKELLMIPRIRDASDHPFAKRFCEECSKLLAAGNSSIRETLREFFSNGSYKTLQHLVQYPGVLEQQNRYDVDRMKQAIDVVRRPHASLRAIGRDYYLGDRTGYMQLADIGIHHIAIAQQLDDSAIGHSIAPTHPYVELILQENFLTAVEKQRCLSHSLDGFTNYSQRAEDPELVKRFDFRRLEYPVPASAEDMGAFIGRDTSRDRALSRYELTRFLTENPAAVTPELLVIASDLATEFRSNYFGEPEDVSPFNYKLRLLVTEAIMVEKEALTGRQKSLEDTLESYIVLKEHGLLKHDEQQILEEMLEVWIESLPPEEQKAACESLLFARSVERYPSETGEDAMFNLSYSGFIDNPDFRSAIMDRYVPLLVEELGLDDGSSEYVASKAARIQDVLENLSDGTAYEIMNRVAPAIEAQRGVCSLIRQHFQTSNYAVLETSNITLLFGKGMISHISDSQKNREETLKFLREPLSEASLDQYYQTTFRSYFGALSQFSPAAAAYLLRGLNMSHIDEVRGKLESFHKNFWKMTPEAQVVFMDKIVLPVSLSPAERKEAIRANIKVGLDRALTPDMEYRTIAHEMATVFLEELDDDACRLMTAMAFVSHNPYEDEKRLGEVLSRVLGVGLDVAGDKLLQGIHSAAEVPQDVKEDVAASKMNASPVPRWELAHWIDERGPGRAVERIGTELGSGASAVTVQVFDSEGPFALKVLRPEVAYRGERHFGRAERAADRLYTQHRRYRMLPDIVKEARRSFRIEVDTTNLETQLDHAHTCYDDVLIRVGDKSYVFPVADLRSPESAPAIGKEYSCFELAEGEHFNDLVERSAEELESHAMAHATIELYNRLRGVAICSDRHGGQQKVLEDEKVRSTQLDVAAFQLQHPTDEMMKSLGTVINASVLRAMRQQLTGRLFRLFGGAETSGMSNFAVTFSEQCDRIALKQSPEVKQYLNSIKRSFLANGDFFNQLSTEQLSSCIKSVFDTGEVHPQIQSQLGYFSRRWLQGLQSQETGVSLSIQTSSKVTEP